MEETLMNLLNNVIEFKRLKFSRLYFLTEIEVN